MAFSIRPEVALIDIGLPGLDGNEVARRIRELLGGHDISLIAMTGYGQPEDRRRALQAGFDRYLVKPVDPAELSRLLGEARQSSSEGRQAASA
jgi:CheY-like chemotaxis protein